MKANVSDQQILEKRIIELIQEIYRKYPSGGALHIVLDDGNTEDKHIQWCIDNMEEYTEEPSDMPMFKECAELLMSIKESKRDKIIYKAFKEMQIWAVNGV